MAPRKNRRSVYDPNIGGDRLEKTGVFDRDPLAMQPHPDMEDIRSISDHEDLRDPIIHSGVNKGRHQIKWKYLIALAVIGLVIITIVATTGGKEDKSTSSSSTVEDFPDYQQGDVLEQPPSDLMYLCSQEMIDTDEGRAKCSMQCDKAECCDFPTHLSISCLAGNEATCQAYHRACWILEVEPDDIQEPVLGGVPEPESDVADVCSYENLLTVSGFNDCQAVCEPGRCCYDTDVPSCAMNEVCNGYSFCFGLKAINQQHEDIPRLVHAKCSGANSNPDDREACETICSQALCCFLPPDQCNLEDRTFCYQYEGCAPVLGLALQMDDTTDEEVALAPPPANLREVCSEDNISVVNGRVQCEEACSPADDCDNSDFAAENHAICQQYHSVCWILYEGATRIEETPEFSPPDESFNEVCSFSSMDSQEGIENCREFCEPVSCCWKQGVESCAFDEMCKSYSQCHILRSTYDEFDNASPPVEGEEGDQGEALPPPPADLMDLCSEASISTANGRVVCQDACSRADCCDNDAYCAAVNHDVCQQYHSACWTLYEGSTRIEETPEFSPPDESIANEVCSLNNMDSEIGYKDCREMCDPVKCCWQQGVESCAFDEMCEQFSKCFILRMYDDNSESGNGSFQQDPEPETTLTFPPVNLASVCSKENISTLSGRNQCVADCAPSDCCQTGECLEGNEEICQMYRKSCGILDSGSGLVTQNPPPVTTLTFPPVDLASVCSQENISTLSGRKQCEADCAVSDCCDTGVCFEGNHEICHMYHKSCWILHDDATAIEATPEFSPPGDGFKDACTWENVASAVGEAECETHCMPVECCWAPGVETCAFADVCNAYSECYILRVDQVYDEYPGSDGEPAEGLDEDEPTNGFDYNVLIPPPNDLPIICSRENVELMTSRKKCEDQCSKASCCALDIGSPESCLDNNQYLCQLYHQSCWILDRDAQPVQTVPEFRPAPFNIDEACDLNNLKTDTGYNDCLNACEPAKCCFGTTVDGTTCAWHERCEEYAMCLSLAVFDGDFEPNYSFEEGSNTANSGSSENPANSSGPTKSEVDHACSLIILDECEDLCAAGACCRTGCYGFNADVDCSIYESCSVLW